VRVITEVISEVSTVVEEPETRVCPAVKVVVKTDPLTGEAKDDEVLEAAGSADEVVVADARHAGSVQVTVAVRVRVITEVMSEVSTVVEAPETRVCPAVNVVV